MKKLKDFKYFYENHKRTFNNQVEVIAYDESELRWLKVAISPEVGLYSGGCFHFMVSV